MQSKKVLVIFMVLLFGFTGCMSSLPVNNVKASSTGYIATFDEVCSMLSSCVAFYPDTQKLLTSDGVININAAPFMKENELYVPLETVNNIFQSSVEYNSASASFLTKDEICYISLSSFAEAENLELFDDSLTDLYIIGSNPPDLNWNDNRREISGIIGQLIFDFPSADDIVSDIEKNIGSSSHPRILATSRDFQRIKNETDKASGSFDPLKKHWLDLIELQRQTASAKEPVVYGPTDHIRMRVQSGTFYNVTGLNSFMYKLTGNNECAERAWQEIYTICSDGFPDWNPMHLLDTGQFMNGMAISYDWLYDWLSDEQKETMRRNIIDKGLAVMCDVFDKVPVNSSWNEGSTGRIYSFYEESTNWNFVCVGGALMAALSIFDECEGADREICERVLREGVKILSYAVCCFSPSGDWFEGPSYWALTNETLTEACAALQTAAGTDYGIMDAPGVSQTCEVAFSLIGEYSFNYGNADAVNAGGLPNTREMFYHANRFNRPDYAKQRFMIMDEYNIAPGFRDMIYCTQSFEAEPISLKTDYYLKKSEIVTMRNADVEEGLIFAGLHGGDNYSAAGQLDVGQFLIDSFGDRFAWDVGYENYNLFTGSRYEMYRARAEGHNTLVINPATQTEEEYEDQYCYAIEEITRHEYNSSSSIAVLDMSDAYRDYVSSATRGMKFINDRTSILIQDEVRDVKKVLNNENINENEVWWFMHTKAEITLANNNKLAVLDIDGNKMYVTLLTDGEFGIMAAEPLPSSPNPEGQSSNAEFQKLYIKLSGIENADIAVCFTPGYCYESLELPDVIPISDWTLDNSKTDTDVPYLTSITIGGNSLDGFSSQVLDYEYPYCTDGMIPAIEATGNGRVSVKYPDTLPAKAYITVSSATQDATYSVFLKEEKDNFEKAQFKKLSIQGIYSPLTGAFKSADDDAETYLTMNKSDYVVYDLAEIEFVDYIFVSGKEINAEIYCSSDGVNYSYIDDISQDSFGSIFSPDCTARYIKLVSKSVGCEISEVNFYEFDGFEYLSADGTDAELQFITALYQTDDAAELVSVNIKNIFLTEKCAVSDFITVPDDGKSYIASVFVWIDDTLAPLVKNVCVR